MAKTLSITLPDELAERLRTEVEQGRFVDESDAVTRALTHALDDQASLSDEQLEAFFTREVRPVFDRLDADPSLGRTVDEIRASLAGHHRQNLALRK